MTNTQLFISGMATMMLIVSVVLNIILISVRFETVPDATIFGYTKEQRAQMDALAEKLNK